MVQPAISIEDLKGQLSSPATGADFAKHFAARYFNPALGSLPKTEIDQLVFECLVTVGLIDPEGPLFAVTRALNVSPSKARALVFQYQLRQPIDSAALDAKVLASLGSASFSVDDKRLAFGVESPLVRAAIQARLKTLNIFADISLSGEILRVPISDFGTFLTSFLTDKEVAEIKRKLQKQGDLPKGKLARLISKGAEKAAEEGGKEGVKAFIPHLIDWLAVGATTAAPHLVMTIMGG